MKHLFLALTPSIAIVLSACGGSSTGPNADAVVVGPPQTKAQLETRYLEVLTIIEGGGRVRHIQPTPKCHYRGAPL